MKRFHVLNNFDCVHSCHETILGAIRAGNKLARLRPADYICVWSYRTELAVGEYAGVIVGREIAVKKWGESKLTRSKP